MGRGGGRGTGVIPLRASNIEDANNAISVSSVEGVAISAPAEGSADGVLHLAAESLNGVLVEVGNDALALEIPDLDGGLSSSTEPVSVGAEGEGVDDGSSLEGVQVLALVQVPETSCSVFATGGAKGTVWADGDGVQVASVAYQIVLELAVAKAPDLDELVPSARHNDGGLSVGAETNAADPLGVAFLLEGVLALTENVPQLDGLVAGTRDNLAVVSGESNREHILSVANKAAGGGTGVDVPQAEHAVPRAGQAELTIRGHDNILHEVSVSARDNQYNAQKGKNALRLKHTPSRHAWACSRSPDREQHSRTRWSCLNGDLIQHHKKK